LALVSAKQPQGQAFVILQVVFGNICYIGDRNLSYIIMSIRLVGFYCAGSEFNVQIGKSIKNLLLNF